MVVIIKIFGGEKRPAILFVVATWMDDCTKSLQRKKIEIIQVGYYKH